MNRRSFIKNLHLFGLTLSFANPISIFANPLKPYYPPTLKGIRGSHDSAFKYAHQIAFNNKSFKPNTEFKEEYDLIVVGAGISGLSSALFYLRDINPNAKILILDNHDDFGGHAKRNEFEVDGKTLLSYGGTQSFDTISEYSDVSLDLIKQLGIDLSKFDKYYDKTFFDRYNLTSGIFYDKENYTENKIVKSMFPVNISFQNFSDGYMPYLQVSPSFESTFDDIPFDKKSKDKLDEIFNSNKNIDDYKDMNYVEFLNEAFDVTNKSLIELLSNVSSDDMALAGKAIGVEEASYGGFYGLSKPIISKLAGFFDNEKYIHHFPDGNATLARTMVKQLIPTVSTFDNVEQCVTAKFDYSKLDQETNQVKIRLNSTASSIKNINNKTQIEYIKDDKIYVANAKQTVMAGWHTMASFIVKDLPKKQKKALRANIKMPLVYVQVALKNWKFIEKSGVATNYCPSSYYQFVNMDFPINIGSYKAIQDPSKPTVLTMMRMPTPTNIDKDIPDLLKMGRYDLLGTSYDTFKNNIKKQLTNMYSQYGFDYDRDVSDIIINRWSHGYTYEGAFEDTPYTYKMARKNVGNIFFANSDSKGAAYTDAAIDMAYKAVNKIKKEKMK